MVGNVVSTVPVPLLLYGMCMLLVMRMYVGADRTEVLPFGNGSPLFCFIVRVFEPKCSCVHMGGLIREFGTVDAVNVFGVACTSLYACTSVWIVLYDLP